MNCPYCKTPNKPTAQTCWSCGRKLEPTVNQHEQPKEKGKASCPYVLVVIAGLLAAILCTLLFNLSKSEESNIEQHLIVVVSDFVDLPAEFKHVDSESKIKDVAEYGGSCSILYSEVAKLNPNYDKHRHYGTHGNVSSAFDFFASYGWRLVSQDGKSVYIFTRKSKR